MMEQLQETMAGLPEAPAAAWTQAVHCGLCQPELSLDTKALNARLTRLEEQMKSSAFVPAAPVKAEKAAPEKDEYGGTIARPAGRCRRTPAEDAPPVAESEALGFWSDLVAAVRKELKPPVSGFFVVTPNAPVQGALVRQAGASVQQQLYGADVGQTGNSGGHLPEEQQQCCPIR